MDLALEPLTAALASCCPEPVDLEWLEDLEGERAVAALRAGAGGGAALRLDPCDFQLVHKVRQPADVPLQLGEPGLGLLGLTPEAGQGGLPILLHGA